MQPLFRFNDSLERFEALRSLGVADVLKLTDVSVEYSPGVALLLEREETLSCRLNNGMFANFKLAGIDKLFGMLICEVQSLQISPSWKMPYVKTIRMFGNWAPGEEASSANKREVNGRYLYRRNKNTESQSAEYKVKVNPDGEVMVSLISPVDVWQALELQDSIKRVLELENSGFRVEKAVLISDENGAQSFLSKFLIARNERTVKKEKQEIKVPNVRADSNLVGLLENLQYLDEVYQCELNNDLKLFILCVQAVKIFELFYEGFKSGSRMSVVAQYLELEKLNDGTVDPPTEKVLTGTVDCFDWEPDIKQFATQVAKFIAFYRNAGVHTSQSLSKMRQRGFGTEPQLADWIRMLCYKVVCDVWPTRVLQRGLIQCVSRVRLG